MYVGDAARDRILVIASTLSNRICSSHTVMTIKIRLARFGRRNAPFYNIVVAHAR